MSTFKYTLPITSYRSAYVFEIPPKNAAPVAAARNGFSLVNRNSFAAAHITANNMKISPRTANDCTAMNQSENIMII